MKIPIMITMYTIIDRSEQNVEEIKIHTIGNLYKKGDRIFIQFEESDQDYGKVNQVIKVEQSKRITIHRHGTVSMKQEFREGHRTEGVYQTSFVQLFMETLTKTVSVEINENMEGSIFFTYLLTIQNEFAGNYDVKINFRRHES